VAESLQGFSGNALKNPDRLLSQAESEAALANVLASLLFQGIHGLRELGILFDRVT
jgi:hypothetical protein